MMGRPAAHSEVRATATDRGVVGFQAAGVPDEVLTSDAVAQELDQSSLAVLVKFFQLLDRWHWEANSPC
jgi:hypothetical protein